MRAFLSGACVGLAMMLAAGCPPCGDMGDPTLITLESGSYTGTPLAYDDRIIDLMPEGSDVSADLDLEGAVITLSWTAEDGSNNELTLELGSIEVDDTY